MGGSGSGSADYPWHLKTPPLSSAYTMHRDQRDGVDVIVFTVGKTVLLYDARRLDDLHAMLRAHDDWMELGSADEQKPAKDGTVEAWGRPGSNPIGGWYGLKKGLRGRFGMYVPPLMEHLGLAEVEHNARGNRMRSMKGPLVRQPTRRMATRRGQRSCQQPRHGPQCRPRRPRRRTGPPSSLR